MFSVLSLHFIALLASVSVESAGNSILHQQRQQRPSKVVELHCSKQPVPMSIELNSRHFFTQNSSKSGKDSPPTVSFFSTGQFITTKLPLPFVQHPDPKDTFVSSFMLLRTNPDRLCRQLSPITSDFKRGYTLRFQCSMEALHSMEFIAITSMLLFTIKKSESFLMMSVC